MPVLESDQPGSPLVQDSTAVIPSETMAGRLSSLLVEDPPQVVAEQAGPGAASSLNLAGVALDTAGHGMDMEMEYVVWMLDSDLYGSSSTVMAMAASASATIEQEQR